MRRTKYVVAAVLVALTGYVGLDALDVVPGALTSDLSVTAGDASPEQPAPSAAEPGESAGAPAPAPPLAPLSASAAHPSPERVAAVVRPLLAAPDLGRGVAVDIRDGATGARLFATGAETPKTPASTAKLLTAAAIAARIDLTRPFTTRAVAGAQPAQVVLVAGGDNLLAAGVGDPHQVPGRAGLADLAARTAAALKARGGTTTPVQVLLDDRFGRGPALAPRWEAPDVAAGLTGPVALLGLASDRAHHGAPAGPDPALTAATTFRAALAARGVAVAPGVARGAAPQGAAELGSVDSAPIGDVLALALDESDNDLTESVARHACVRDGAPATFQGCADWVVRRLAELGVDTTGLRLLDTSGLTRGSTVPARALADVMVLVTAGREPALARVVADLPVGGLTGTLAQRYRQGPARAAAGLVRAKTGTLTGVGSLAGTVVDADGRLLVFALLADQAPPGRTEATRAALDRIVAALAGCGCR